jgi:DNA-directed RNA polymerase specialized sigma24 family protein
MASPVSIRSVEPVAWFATTHWSVVLAASGKDPAVGSSALEKLCQTYWRPLYAYVRRRGHGPEDAQDLTQSFFKRLLEKDYLRLADKERGRFRTFLLTSLQRFLINDWEHQRATKRCGGQAQLSWDGEAAEAFYLSERSDHLSPEKLYERRWAISLLEAVLSQLRQEYARSSKAELFEELKGLLWGESEDDSYSAPARRLETNEGALRVAMHRFRRRYRDLLRVEIAQTVADPGEIEDEIRQLFSALG